MRKVSRYMLTLLCVMVLMLTIALGASAERVIQNSGSFSSGVRYVLYTDGELVISGTGSTYFSDYLSPVYKYKSYIKTVVIGEGVTSVSDGLFQFCSEITAVSIPSSVNTIGEEAFNGCTKLTSVSFAEGSTSLTIGKDAFKGCAMLTSVSFAKGLTSIGESAFEDCAALTNVAFPKGLTFIGESAFEDCDAMTSVTLPSGLTTISNEAFRSCNSLQKVTMSDTVTTMGTDVFKGCNALTTLRLSKKLTTIPSSAFAELSALTSVTIPSGVTTIGTGAFEKCTSLKKVTIPDTVTSMGTDVFRECTALTSATFSKKMTEVPDYTFYKCTALKTVSLQKGITTIGKYAFYNCESLASITLPSTLTTIDKYAFDRSATYETFVLPKSVTTLAGGSYSENIPRAKTLVILNKDLAITDNQVNFDNTVVVGYPGSTAETLVKNRSDASFRSIYCEAPKLVSISNTAAGVHIKWKASANATTYTILRKASAKDKWTAVKTVNAPTVKCTDSSAKAGTQYIYSVRANNAWANGKHDNNGLTVTRLAVPKVTAAKSTTKGIQLSWSAASGAKTYEVYRNKKFVAEVSGKSYIDNAVQYGKSYTYYIVAKSAIGSTSANSNEIKAAVKYVSPTVVSLSVPKKGQIKVTWQKIGGADKYVVYRSTDAKTGFKKIATTTSNAYTDKTVKFGTLYYYKVQTIDGAKKSESAVVKIRATIPLPAFSTTVKVTSKSVNLTWKKVSDASGYYLYIQSGSTWKKIATIKKNKTTSYTYSTKAGQTFKVVAYVVKSGKTYVSEGCVAYFTPLSVASSLKVDQYNEEVTNKVTWKAVKNATAYQVYRKNTSTGDWKYLKTVEDNQYIKGVQHGKFIYWKVKAICEKDGYTSVGEYSNSKGLIIYYKPSFTGFVSDKVSTNKWAIIIIENNGKYDMKIKSSGAYIWNGSSYPTLNGSISLVDGSLNYAKSVTIKPGEKQAVSFYIDGPKAGYQDRNTRITFYFDYDGVRYKAYTNPQRYGVNKTTYEKVGFVDE